MIDWTAVLVAVATYGLPVALTYLGGALHMWLRLHRDAEIGRSIRPRAGKRHPTELETRPDPPDPPG